jgi:glycosyltransferase involved in cell wall biosynthesis
MTPRVSVIIPVYNRARTVSPTLESVRAQNIGDLESLVVDYRKKDSEELRAAVKRLGDPRFRYVGRENGGASAARNTGVGDAKGEIVAFLDSDDRWLPEKLERDLEAGADWRVVFSAVAMERDGRIAEMRPTVRPRIGEPMSEYLACRGGWTATSTMSLPHQLARSVPFDETVKFGGDDTDFAIRLAAEGAEFHMLERSSVILLDDETGDRLSRSNDWRAALDWLDKIQPLVSRKALLAYRGWHVARMAADSRHPVKALRFFTEAFVRGAFTPTIAVLALAQIVRQTLRTWSRRQPA